MKLSKRTKEVLSQFSLMDGYIKFKKGKKQIQLRPEDIHIDSDFYGNRRFEEREKALYAKFSQNEDLKDVLLATKNAVLKQYIPKRVSTDDILLMKIRNRLQIEN
jgi:hypothetical protein